MDAIIAVIVVDDMNKREVVAQRKGGYEVAVSYNPAADYPQAPTYAVTAERSSIADDPSLNRRSIEHEAGNSKGDCHAESTSIPQIRVEGVAGGDRRASGGAGQRVGAVRTTGGE
jgi:hypothetical protein